MCIKEDDKFQLHLESRYSYIQLKCGWDNWRPTCSLSGNAKTKEQIHVYASVFFMFCLVLGLWYRASLQSQ